MSAVRRILYAAAALCLAATMQCTNALHRVRRGRHRDRCRCGHARLADNSIPTDAAVFVRPAGFLAGADPGKRHWPTRRLTPAAIFAWIQLLPAPMLWKSTNLSHNSGLVACSVVVSGNGTFDIGTDTIRPYASISGSVLLPSGAGANTYVQVFDLQPARSNDSSGAYVLSNMPTGVFRLRIVGPAGTIGYRDTSNICAKNIGLAPAGAVRVRFASEYSRVAVADVPARPDNPPA